MQESEKRKFKRIVYNHYRKHGRNDLPWRRVHHPYAIVVSEIMLQQTQAYRVVEKFNLFLKQFPTLRHLSNAPLSAVLKIWNGLGYNRRAKFLHQMARFLVSNKKKIPRTIAGLEKLPGIGTYTARAVAVFAFNEPVVLIETNIRTVYLQHFFKGKKGITDKELERVIAMTLDQKNPRTWYSALMDYGAYLKQQGSIAHRNSAHYKKQSSFLGSRRQARGIIIRQLVKGSKSVSALKRLVGATEHNTEEVIETLVTEGLIKRKGERLSLVLT